jgi:hypothetical protein
MCQPPISEPVQLGISAFGVRLAKHRPEEMNLEAGELFLINRALARHNREILCSPPKILCPAGAPLTVVCRKVSPAR